MNAQNQTEPTRASDLAVGSSDLLGVRSKCTLEENINRAGAELPDGWIIEINVEAGAGWVTLYDGCGNSVDVSGAGSINEQVSEAISYAREHS